MRIFNQAELKADVVGALADKNDENTNQYRYVTWVTESAIKWLVKNDKEFLDKFTSPVTANALSIFQGAGSGLEAYNFVDAFGTKQRAYLENEFDIKDARAGILRAYVPKVSLHWWLYNSRYKFVEIRDFIYAKVAQDPEVDLRKYTLDQMPKHIQRWHQELEVQREQERLAALRKLQEDTERENNYLKALVDLQVYDAGRIGTLDFERTRLLNRVWNCLVKGVDYDELGQFGGYQVLRLKSAKALAFEGEAKGSCIGRQDYIDRLHDNTTALVSLRSMQAPFVPWPEFTAEFKRRAGKWEKIQLENWGYRWGRHHELESDGVRLKAERAISDALLAYKPPVTDTFTLNRYN